MNNRLISFVAVVGSVFAVAHASASTKGATAKKSAPGAANSTITGNVPKTRPLVAMSGSGSLSSSSSERSSYIGLEILPYTYLNLKTTVDKTSTETPQSLLTSMTKAVEFYGHFGVWSIRPTLSLDGDSPSSVGIGYDFSPNLELGAVVTYQRGYSKNSAAKSETVTSTLAFGPQAFYYTEVAGFPLEVDAQLLLTGASEETTNDGTTTKNKDESGYLMAAGAKIVRPLGAGLEYFAGVGLGYVSSTDKKYKENAKDPNVKEQEKTVSGAVFKIVPAGVRFAF